MGTGIVAVLLHQFPSWPLRHFRRLLHSLHPPLYPSLHSEYCPICSVGHIWRFITTNAKTLRSAGFFRLLCSRSVERALGGREASQLDTRLLSIFLVY